MTSHSAFSELARFNEQSHDFFRWWKQEMAGLVPDVLRSLFRKTELIEPVLIISRTGYRLSGDTAHPLESLPAALASLKRADGRERIQLALVLDETRYLTRKISNRRLPLSDLRRAAELDILTETPFKIDDVQIFLREKTQGPAIYYIVRRNIIDELRAQFDLLPIDITAVRLGAHQIPILPASWAPGLQPKRRNTIRFLGYFSLLLTVLSCLYIFSELDRAMTEVAGTLDVEIDAAKKRAHAARATFDFHAGRLQQLKALKAKQAETLEIVAIWEELSRVLPDTSFLTDLNIKNETMEITGYSTTPASLIGRLEESPLFAGARFTSPVVKVPGFDGDNFLISFERERK